MAPGCTTSLVEDSYRIECPTMELCKGKRAGFSLQIYRKVLRATSFLDPGECQMPRPSTQLLLALNENKNAEYQINTS